MPVFTEAEVRKLFRQSMLADNGIFELSKDEKITPAAKGFLNDHHVQVIYSNQSKKKASAANDEQVKRRVAAIGDTAVYSLLFKLTRLYTYFLRNQRALHLTFQDEKCEQMGILLTVVENMVSRNIQEDISDYHPSLTNSTELQAIRISRQLDQENVKMSYKAADWQLACYETYIETTLLRKEIERITAETHNSLAYKVVQLLKSIEVLLWLIAE